LILGGFCGASIALPRGVLSPPLDVTAAFSISISMSMYEFVSQSSVRDQAPGDYKSVVDASTARSSAFFHFPELAASRP